MGHVSILFGGPEADSIPDVVINNSEFPSYQTEFGRDCTGIGDFNGDGVDDFAFSAMEFNRGTVYLVSGKSIATGVRHDYDPILPEGFRLGQNYPNPFNSATTIEFDLPYRTQVQLVVYNILGREVMKLVDRELPAGSHRVEWNGADSRANLLASGVYFYRLTADGQKHDAKKMLLLK
jgi:hypothetical protein